MKYGITKTSLQNTNNKKKLFNSTKATFEGMIGIFSSHWTDYWSKHQSLGIQHPHSRECVLKDHGKNSVMTPAENILLLSSKGNTLLSRTNNQLLTVVGNLTRCTWPIVLHVLYNSWTFTCQPWSIRLNKPSTSCYFWMRDPTNPNPRTWAPAAAPRAGRRPYHLHDRHLGLIAPDKPLSPHRGWECSGRILIGGDGTYDCHISGGPAKCGAPVNTVVRGRFIYHRAIRRPALWIDWPLKYLFNLFDQLISGEYSPLDYSCIIRPEVTVGILFGIFIRLGNV